MARGVNGGAMARDGEGWRGMARNGEAPPPGGPGGPMGTQMTPEHIKLTTLNEKLPGCIEHYKIFKNNAK